MTAPVTTSGSAPKIFLSHTSDLRSVPRRRSYVAAAEAAVTMAGYTIADMAYFPAADRPPADVCRAAVHAARALVLIAGFRHGTTIPDQPAISYTEWEFTVAGEARIPRLVFMLHESADGAPDLIGDPADAERQHAFRDRLSKSSDLTLVNVDSPATLQAHLLHTLYTELSEPAAEKSTGGGPIVLAHNSSAIQVGDDTTMVAHFTDGTQKRWRWPWCRPRR